MKTLAGFVSYTGRVCQPENRFFDGILKAGWKQVEPTPLSREAAVNWLQNRMSI
jgi:hypothetical protein